MQKACFLLRCSLFSQNSFAKIIISVRLFVILPSKLIMFIIRLKTSSKDGSAYRFPRGLYLTVSQTVCLSCRSCVLLCVLIRVPFRKLIIPYCGKVAKWHCGTFLFSIFTLCQCLLSVFSIQPSRRQRVMIFLRADSPQYPRFNARRSSIVNNLPFRHFATLPH